MRELSQVSQKKPTTPSFTFALVADTIYTANGSFTATINASARISQRCFGFNQMTQRCKCFIVRTTHWLISNTTICSCIN